MRHDSSVPGDFMNQLSFLLFSLFFAVSSQVAWASPSCGEKLLDRFQVDSKAYQVSADLDESMSQQAQARELVRRLLAKMQCGSEEVTLNKITCRRIVPNNPITQVCHVSANIGYFFVMKDMLTTGNVVFNRWD